MLLHLNLKADASPLRPHRLQGGRVCRSQAQRYPPFPQRSVATKIRLTRDPVLPAEGVLAHDQHIQRVPQLRHTILSTQAPGRATGLDPEHDPR